LARQRFELGFGEPDARQAGDTLYGSPVEHHDLTVSRLSSVMILDNPVELREAVSAGMRLMGLDVGTKTIGLALSDTRRVIASPLETIRRRRFAEDMARLFALVDAHGVGGLVVGLPLTLAGGDGPRTQSVRQFA